ncbi:CarboxypepD_reg-like domain-containing protein [Micromonospora phaseoli]|uniref:alpha-amylase n=2 Tax=Micromonospora phaseoli TaxID=1144548 RepID=A0A1H7C348_9ACTN|nr:carboxypeptidase-like protein [Micromonospora phaseoli]SEJ84111.1 CarboxypepD_reg-like domain-containing protein [Micromonospora phaseoli]
MAVAALLVVTSPAAAGPKTGSAGAQNRKPSPPTDLRSDGKTCAAGTSRPYVLTATPYLSAMQSDPDQGQQSLTTWFHWWPSDGVRNGTDRVAQSAGNSSSVSAAVPEGELSDGQTYAWQARTHDGARYGAWSETCEFTVDLTPPPPPGAVTSTDYPNDAGPRGGVGIAGVFEVAPPAERPHEVVEYIYTFDSSSALTWSVQPRASDHGASITVAPPRDGVNTLSVWSKDAAGRRSQSPSTYTFRVRGPAGPAGGWNFDEADGPASDVTAHGNTITLDGGADRTTGRGGVGNALALNGSTAWAGTAGPVLIENPDTGLPTPVRTDTSFTVTARVKLTGASTTGFQTAVGADATRRSPFTLGYDAEVGKWRFSMTAADTETAESRHAYSDGSAVAGRWTHLAAAYEAPTGTLRLYVNGEPQSTTATLPSAFNASGGLTIGRRMWDGSPDSFLDGAVDDVQIYNYLESPSRFAEMAAPLPPVISFPDGEQTTTGSTITVRFDAGGDTNVTTFRYDSRAISLGADVAATEPGGTAVVTIEAGNVAGSRLLLAASVDDGGRRSGLAQAEYTVVAKWSLTGMVIDTTTWQPAAGAVVTLEPGGFQTTAGADGNYTFVDVPSGMYTISTTHCGLSASDPISISGQGDYWDVYLFPNGESPGEGCPA